MSNQKQLTAAEALYLSNLNRRPRNAPPDEIFAAIEDAAKSGEATQVYAPKIIGRPLTQEEWNYMVSLGYSKGYQAPDFFDGPIMWGISKGPYHPKGQPFEPLSE